MQHQKRSMSAGATESKSQLQRLSHLPACCSWAVAFATSGTRIKLYISFESPNPRDAHRGLQLVRPSCPASPLSNAARLTVGHCPGWQMSQDNLGLCALAPMVDATYPTWSMPAVPLVLGSACTWDILAADSHRLRVVLYFVIRM